MSGTSASITPPTPPQTATTLFDGGSGSITTKDQRANKREDVRSKIALYYIIGFFGIILLGFGTGLWMRFEMESYKDMLIAISGILSGPLGFIIGFYFKESTEN